jgi:hypothetical protein
MLKTEQSELGSGWPQRIQDAWEDYELENAIPHSGSIIYEHGQHWILCDCGASWSVNDMDGDGAMDCFDFEEITDGEANYHL